MLLLFSQAPNIDQIMKKALALLIFSLSFFASGCKTTQQQLASYQGSHINNVIAKNGSPSSLIEDGKGGKIYTFTKSRSIQVAPASSSTTSYGSQGYRTTHTKSSGPKYITIRDNYMFWVDEKGIIYKSAHSRN
jgi:hypothetical protein